MNTPDNVSSTLSSDFAFEIPSSGCQRKLPFSLIFGIKARQQQFPLYKRAAGRFNLLRRIRPFIDKSSAKKIYKAMIQPVFTYCGTLGLCWSHSRKSRIESIERQRQKVIGGNYQVQTLESLIKR